MSDPEGAERREKEKECKPAGVCRVSVFWGDAAAPERCEQATAAVTSRVNENNYSQE